MLHAILRSLTPFEPLIAGTMPLGIHTEASDLDILCHAPDLLAFERVLRATVERYPDFSLRHLADLDPPATVASFRVGDTRIEVFGQALPVYAQNGFRHMLVEGRLLRLGGAALRRRVVALKQDGLATEPAFARVLELAGDPYKALLSLEAEPDEALQRLIHRPEPS